MNSEGAAAQALEHDPIVARWVVVRAHPAWIINKLRRLMPSGDSFQILPSPVFSPSAWGTRAARLKKRLHTLVVYSLVVHECTDHGKPVESR